MDLEQANTGLDLPPEYCRYRDEGCDLADSCLNCPFPRCVYEQPRGRQRWLKRRRDSEMVRLLHTEGKGVNELAVMFGLSQRTVQRVIKNSLSLPTGKDLLTSPPRSPSPSKERGKDGFSEGLRPSATPSSQPSKGKGVNYKRGADAPLKHRVGRGAFMIGISSLHEGEDGFSEGKNKERGASPFLDTPYVESLIERAGNE